ncbi:hypothetical protein BU25DRAFT_474051 [Macroventuria anomochaeta]|uniref:Uncharacterized protein n=1 Tax=Macroventuria anomochaeta TaxID=301207 RepID=A0ACB6RUG3_9PLEO|nr:uncharacterized protein BU25DRAFT_474051 [Macroventuria anomochaeta]KAF2625414.1 hypothetical protein BU25DRAFT_474051 [Macroventuria anomochaeta]
MDVGRIDLTILSLGGATLISALPTAPTGDLRFAAPQWLEQESEVNSGDLANSFVACNPAEDCLSMDVWALANILEGKKLPVLVWTYSGGFTGGSKAENTPEGLFNLSTELIFGSYNYRLGINGLSNGVTVQGALASRTSPAIRVTATSH